MSCDTDYFYNITIKYIKDMGFENSITSDGYVIVYHGTSQKNLRSIIQSGKFNGFPFFALDEKTAAQFARQVGGKPAVGRFVVDPASLLPTGEYLTARVDWLERNVNDIWS